MENRLMVARDENHHGQRPLVHPLGIGTWIFNATMGDAEAAEAQSLNCAILAGYGEQYSKQKV